MFRWVLLKPLPWDPERRFGETVGSDLKYWQGAIEDRGYEFDFLIKYVMFKQIADEEFRKTTVFPHARELADTLAIVLSPHLERLTQSSSKPDDTTKRDWRDKLQQTFVHAITIKQKVEAAAPPDAVFEYVWPKNDEPTSPEWR